MCLGGGCVVDGGDCGYGWCIADFDGDGCGGAVIVVGGGSGFGFVGGLLRERGKDRNYEERWEKG